MTTAHTLSGKPTSYWVDSTPDTTHPQLDRDLSVDVAVVGGGMLGITAALQLKRQGAKVALLEGGRLAGEEPGGDGVVDALPGERVDQPGGVAGHHHAPVTQPQRTPRRQRQVVTAPVAGVRRRPGQEVVELLEEQGHEAAPLLTHDLLQVRRGVAHPLAQSSTSTVGWIWMSYDGSSRNSSTTTSRSGASSR